MEINGKKLDDAKVAAVRENFERNHAASSGKKGRLTFDELLQRFALDCNSLQSIREEHGLSYQRIRELYNHYFRRLFPGARTARKRQRMCTLKRSKVLEHDFSIEFVPWAQAIVAAARENGLSVRRRKCENPHLARCASVKSFKKQEILINDKRCKLHFVTSTSQASSHSTRTYGPCRLRGFTRCDFVVVRQEIKGSHIFVIPTEDLRKKYGERRDIMIYLPVEKGLVTHRDTVDWYQYENAWHLLRA